MISPGSKYKALVIEDRFEDISSFYLNELLRYKSTFEFFWLAEAPEMNSRHESIGFMRGMFYVGSDGRKVLRPLDTLPDKDQPHYAAVYKLFSDADHILVPDEGLVTVVDPELPDELRLKSADEIVGSCLETMTQLSFDLIIADRHLPRLSNFPHEKRTRTFTGGNKDDSEYVGWNGVDLALRYNETKSKKAQIIVFSHVGHRTVGIDRRVYGDDLDVILSNYCDKDEPKHFHAAMERVSENLRARISSIGKQSLAISLEYSQHYEQYRGPRSTQTNRYAEFPLLPLNQKLGGDLAGLYSEIFRRVVLHTYAKHFPVEEGALKKYTAKHLSERLGYENSSESTFPQQLKRVGLTFDKIKRMDISTDEAKWLLSLYADAADPVDPAFSIWLPSSLTQKLMEVAGIQRRSVQSR